MYSLHAMAYTSCDRENQSSGSRLYAAEVIACGLQAFFLRNDPPTKSVLAIVNREIKGKV